MDKLAIIILVLLGVSCAIDLLWTIKRNKEEKEMDEALALFLKHVTESTSDNEIKISANFDTMTVVELKKLAQSKKIPGYYKMKRDELISVLKQD